jgi:hypothetical protein
MNELKHPYSAPESHIFALTPAQCILGVSDPDKSMNRITGDEGTAGDHDGFNGYSYDL